MKWGSNVGRYCTGNDTLASPYSPFQQLADPKTPGPEDRRDIGGSQAGVTTRLPRYRTTIAPTPTMALTTAKARRRLDSRVTAVEMVSDGRNEAEDQANDDEGDEAREEAGHELDPLEPLATNTD